MPFHIIIRGKTPYGKTRSEQESNLRKDGMGSLSEEQLDKCKWVEKKTGVKKGFIKAVDLDKV